VHLPVDWQRLRDRAHAVAAAHGIPARNGLAALLVDCRAATPAGRAAVEGLVRRAELDAAASCRVNVALVSWVLALEPAVPVAVLSLNSRVAVERALRRAGLAGRVARCLGREDVERAKPHPEGLLRLLEAHRVAPEQALMVGDTGADSGCAGAAGVPFVAVADIGVDWRAGPSGARPAGR
jgi:phosphoglycolate phosphatase